MNFNFKTFMTRTEMPESGSLSLH